MAESIVIYFADKLATLVTQESHFVSGVEQHILLLQHEFEFMRSFLKAAERQRRKSDLVEVWVTQIQDIAYDAEDVIDAYTLHLEQTRTLNFIRQMFESWNRFNTLHRIGKQIEQLNTRARRISACRSDYNIDNADAAPDSDAADSILIRKGVPTVEKIGVVGFQKESAQLLNLLKEEAPQRKVISIIGMGGSGKTTLAQTIYKNNDLSSCFNVRVWITVSQKYQIKNILVSVLKQVCGYSFGLETRQELEEEVCRQLKMKKYLVIVDDIWKLQVWDEIKSAFPDNENGSRVILTTRIKEVALNADPSTSNHIELGFLNEKESLELFCNKVFAKPADACPPELVELGEKIVDKCGGLPLAIVVIGGVLLGKERAPDTWSRVLENMPWHLSQDSNQCREILILSYSDLPYYLKSCFLYLGLFPEDFKICAKKLIRLWVAEDFVQARGQINLEDVAEDCLEELAQRSLIQVIYRKFQSGPVLKLQMHDLLRDLAISEGRKDRFMDIHTSNSSTTRTRRLAIHPNISSQERFSTPNLRCLLFFVQENYEKSIFSYGNKMLRVLELEGMEVSKLPKEIGELVFLQYLGLADTKVETLPGSIGNLVKLQTLDIRFTGITVLPKTIWKLKNLRHLLTSSSNCEKIKGSVGDKQDFGRNLLTLDVNTRIWMNKEDTGLSNVLVKQGRLRLLQLLGILEVNTNLKDCFPWSLTELMLVDTLIEDDPSNVLGSLPMLKVLSLFRTSYIGKKMVFSGGGFPQLQYLDIWDLNTLVEWLVADGAMPILRNLRIRGLDELQKLPQGLRNVTSLQKINVCNMRHMKCRIQENGEDWDIIKHIPLVLYGHL